METRSKKLTSSGLAKTPVTPMPRRSARLQKASCCNSQPPNNSKAGVAALMSTPGPLRGVYVFSHVEIDNRPPVYHLRPHKLPRIAEQPAESNGAPLYVIAKRHILFNGQVKYEVEPQNQAEEPLIVSLERILEFVSSRHLQDFENAVSRQEFDEEREVEEAKAKRKAIRVRARKQLQYALRNRPAAAPVASGILKKAKTRAPKGVNATKGSVRRGRPRGRQSISTSSSSTAVPRQQPFGGSSLRRPPLQSLTSEDEIESSDVSAQPSDEVATTRAKRPQRKFGIEVPVSGSAQRQSSSDVSSPSLDAAAVVLQDFTQPRARAPPPDTLPPALLPISRSQSRTMAGNISASSPKRKRVGEPVEDSSTRQQSIKDFTIPSKLHDRFPILRVPEEEEIEDSAPEAVSRSIWSSSSSDVLGSSTTKKRKTPPLPSTSRRKRFKESQDPPPSIRSAGNKITHPAPPEPGQTHRIPPIQAILDDKYETQKFGSKLVISRYFFVRRSEKEYAWIDEDELEDELGDNMLLLETYKDTTHFRTKREKMKGSKSEEEWD